MHHGVAILSKVPIREDHAHDWQDNGEARHVGALLDCGIRIENVYIPAGGETPDLEANPKFRQKLAFLERMTRWSEKLRQPRSEEHTSELQSLMRLSYAVLCLKKQHKTQ